jgi:hypothetical protein
MSLKEYRVWSEAIYAGLHVTMTTKTKGRKIKGKIQQRVTLIFLEACCMSIKEYILFYVHGFQ